MNPDTATPRAKTPFLRFPKSTHEPRHEPTAAAATDPKPSFPASELEQTAAVLSVLTSATVPITPGRPDRALPPGRRILPQIEAVLAALVRVGGLVHTPDAGRSFLPRRAV